MKVKHLPDDLSDTIDQYPFFKELYEGALIFIHIPKTGGTSISHALDFPNPDRNIKKHYRLSHIQPRIPAQQWEQAFKFCFVRNPWDRLFSHYRFRSRRHLLKDPSHYRSFKSWLLHELSPQSKKGHLRPQVEWIQNEQGDIQMDFIGRFEQLKADFQKICTHNLLQISLPHLEKSHPAIDYRDQYDQEMIDLTAAYYEADVRQFNYSF